jgi:pheromone shutdown-related protein TraB
MKVGEKQITLVGTAHVSQESIELVRKTIEKEKPDVVGVELDFQRLHQLRQGKKWQQLDLNQIIREGKTHLFLLNVLLANLQRQIGRQFGVKPGSEMLIAVKIAAENRIPIALLDRDVGITLRRALNKTSLVEKAKLGYSILGGFLGFGPKLDQNTIEKLKEKDVLNALMQQLSKEMPSVKKVLVDERDIFIATRILQTRAKKTVAVVGAGHLEGIKKYLDRPRNLSRLLTVEKKRSALSYLKYLIPALFAIIVAYGFLQKGPEIALNLLVMWFLINGILSALGAAVARAHPLSILAAFLAAPFTSLHPAIAAGWFAGLVELRMRSPKVADFEELPKLSRIRSFASNRVTRVLIVTAFANIGSMIGTVIALPYIASLLL